MRAAHAVLDTETRHPFKGLRGVAVKAEHEGPVYSDAGFVDAVDLLLQAVQ